ncbi:hypothetical protein BH10CHL1_BH10CHL1_46600 [soil metagenome]
MRDVAELAGVSKPTVATVLNGKPGITAETQERIMKAVGTLGYRLDKVARSLRTGQTRTIALVVSDISSPFIGRLAVVVGYSLVLHNTHDNVERRGARGDCAEISVCLNHNGAVGIMLSG